MLLLKQTMVDNSIQVKPIDTEFGQWSLQSLLPNTLVNKTCHMFNPMNNFQNEQYQDVTTKVNLTEAYQ